MIAYETGPFDVFGRLRGHIFSHAKHEWILDGFNCVLCISFWISAIGAFFVSFGFDGFFINWFGIAGAVALMALVTGDDDDIESKS